MSSGPFIRSRYESDTGVIARCRVQPETELLTDGSVFNAAPTGAPTVPFSIKIRPGKRELGIIPRTVQLSFAAGNEPAGYKPGEILSVPVLDPLVFTAFQASSQLTYLGQTADVISFANEDFN